MILGLWCFRRAYTEIFKPSSGYVLDFPCRILVVFVQVHSTIHLVDDELKKAFCPKTLKIYLRLLTTWISSPSRTPNCSTDLFPMQNRQAHPMVFFDFNSFQSQRRSTTSTVFEDLGESFWCFNGVPRDYMRKKRGRYWDRQMEKNGLGLIVINFMWETDDGRNLR